MITVRRLRAALIAACAIGVMATPLVAQSADGGLAIRLALGGGPHEGEYELTHGNPCQHGTPTPETWRLTVTFPDDPAAPSIVDLELGADGSYLDVYFGNDVDQARDLTFTIDDRGDTATLTVAGEATASAGGASFPVDLVVECARVARYGPHPTPTPTLPPGGSPACDLLTSDEIAQVLGNQTSPPDSRSTASCSWYVGDPAVGTSTVSAGLFSGSDPDNNFSVWELRAQTIPDRIVQLEVAGHRALFDRSYTVDSSRSPNIVVETRDGGALVMQHSGPMGDLDPQATLVALAELAVPRLVVMPAATDLPAPTGG
jgi:hypothetical protein